MPIRKGFEQRLQGGERCTAASTSSARTKVLQSFRQNPKPAHPSTWRNSKVAATKTRTKVQAEADTRSVARQKGGDRHHRDALRRGDGACWRRRHGQRGCTAFAGLTSASICRPTPRGREDDAGARTSQPTSPRKHGVADTTTHTGDAHAHQRYTRPNWQKSQQNGARPVATMARSGRRPDSARSS